MATKQDVLDFIEANKDNEDLLVEIRKPINKHCSRMYNARKGGTLVKSETALVVADPLPQQAIYLAKWLGQQVKARYPWYEPRIDEWAKDINDIQRIGCIGESRKASDRFDWGTIKAVAEFSQQDEFWQQQVRSGKNLRKYFNRLLIAAKSYVEKVNKNKVVKI